MEAFTFWPHMDHDYMWRWRLYHADRRMVARSSRSYFDLSDARKAIAKAKNRMIQAAAD